MKKFFYLLILLFSSVVAQAQLKVLVVDDSGDNFGNAEYLASAFDSLGYETVYFDAIGQNISPTMADMNDYDLVVWYTSTWGVGLQLWNGSDVDNPELKAYLAQPNANFWLLGLDYFYDRYGSAPVSFSTGDFGYDYLGISKYAVQSYADDGSVGLPMVTPEIGQPIVGLGDLTWQFSTLWYADGFELRPNAQPIYLFGGPSYVLSGTPTGVLYHPSNGARVLTYGFDLALASSFEMMHNNVSTVMNWWESEITSSHNLPSDWTAVTMSPNAFSDHLNITVKMQKTSPLSVRLYNVSGQLISQLADQENVTANVEKNFHWSVPAGLPDGIYYCSLQSGQQVYTTKLLKRGR